MVQENNASQQIYDLLVTRDLDPKALDNMGKPTVNPSEADLFSFNFRTENQEYGTVVILVNGDNDLEVFYGDNLGKSMEVDDKEHWYDFLSSVRMLAKRHLLTFSLNNMNKLKFKMATMADLAEGVLLEAWKGQGKSKSYSNQPGNAKVVIQHSRAIGEDEQRFRNIGALFVENAQGERFRMPFKSIAGAKAMARHVSEGGTPYDAFGQHISETIKEIGTLGKFVRASRSNAFAQNDQALSIVEDAVKHYANLKRKAKKMIGKRGYKEIFSSFNPSMEVTELDETVDAVREVFVNSAIDSRIEEALPILAKIKENTMKEVDQFENWTNQIMEGTWALPETQEDMAKLQELMSKPLPCGPDGEYASEQLYSLIGDDELFDNIYDLSQKKGADADCRDVVKDRAQELGVKIDVEESIVENPTEQETASGYQAGQSAAAAGKERSMAMNLGGEKAAMKTTAGGTDIEEAYEFKPNPGKYSFYTTPEVNLSVQDYIAMVKKADADGYGSEPIYDAVYGRYGQQVEDYVVELQNDISAEMGLHPKDDYEQIEQEAFEQILDEGMDSFVNPNDQDATRSKTDVPTKDLDADDMTENKTPGDSHYNLQKAKEAAKKDGKNPERLTHAELMKYIDSVTEIEDIDTGKQALKAERDPMLERILYLAKG